MQILEVNPVLVGLSLIYTKRLTGMFQYCVRQTAEVENQVSGNQFPLYMCTYISLIIRFFIIFFYLASPQGQGHHNSVSQLLWARIT